MENARQAMKNITEKLSVKEFECAVIGMSALNERATAEETEKFCSNVINSHKIIMDSDLFVALEAMNAENECAAIISGTGSMAVMRNADGKISHTGGWGYILGDEGSGYSIGLSGIKSAIKSAENRGPETSLLGECLKYFSISSIYELIDLYYEKTVSRKVTAAFAKNVCKCAESGDDVAINIIEAEADELSKTALGLLKEAKKEIPIGLWGGIFQNIAIFRNRFIKSLSVKGFNVVNLISFTPEIGAVFAAYKESGVEIVDTVKENIKETYLNIVL